MTLTSVGDQSRLFLSRRLTAQVRDRVDRLSVELSSGKKQRLSTPATGDVTHLLAIQRDQRLVASYRTITAEASVVASAAQQALGGVADMAGAVIPGILQSVPFRDPLQMGIAADSARTAFGTAVTALNLSVGGMSVFAGDRVDGPALADAESMLADLAAATAGETTASGLIATVDAWFAPGGGFETTGYKGDAGAPEFRIGQGEVASIGLTAATPQIRTALRGLALAALSGQLADPAAQAAVLGNAGAALRGGVDGLTELRAGLGATEAHLEARTAALSAQATALLEAEGKLTGADPYETATALNDATARLEAIYTVTARLSRLSLTEYLR